MTFAVVLGVSLYAGFAAGTWAIVREPRPDARSRRISILLGALWPLTLLCAIAAVWEEGI